MVCTTDHQQKTGEWFTIGKIFCPLLHKVFFLGFGFLNMQVILGNWSQISIGASKIFFTMKVVKYWNRFSREVIDAPSQERFKVWLDRALSNMIQLKMYLLSF